VALIVGEAGIGKSRLLQRFHELIAGTPHTWVEAAAAPFYQNTPFYPVSEVRHPGVTVTDARGKEFDEATAGALTAGPDNRRQRLQPGSDQCRRRDEIM